MSTPKDPLLENEATDRTYYATGVLLDTNDFIAEQTYHRGRLARALATLHGVGTAAGLRVVHEEHQDAPQEGEIAVQPGLAVDPLGRLVEVSTLSCIRVKRWYEGYASNKLLRRPKEQFNIGTVTGTLPDEGVVADLFLRFRVYERGWTPALASGLYDATDAVSPARLRDGYELRLVPRIENVPPDVPELPWPMPTDGKPWPDQSVADEAARRSALKDAILSAWHPGRPALLDRLWGSDFLPEELRFDKDQPEGKVPDPAWVFLARVVIGVDGNTDTGNRPIRNGAVAINNEMRPFAVTVAALARWLGI
ncbi:hypothetical protein ACN28E_21165 [Archangium lansingense]|uniref:hypothetical protein n=1 Tax=Archangium lansingense TaxID=2995310 RepID=UPI003B7D1950